MNRVIFLDNLRYLMVLLVVVLHTAISYGKFVPWWCVKDTGSVFFDLLLLALDSFLMPVLFFIAGYFAIPSFQNKGFYGFLRGKLKRLGLPILIAVPLTSPTFAFLYHHTRQGESFYMTFPEYWAAYMKGAGDFHVGVVRSIDHFGQSHLWFLSLLLFFFTIFALYADQQNRSKDLKATSAGKSASGKSILLLLMSVGVLSAISTFAAKLLFAGPSNPQPWISIGPLLLFQPERIFMYLMYFGMGVVAYAREWFARSVIPGHLFFWILAAFISFVCLLVVLKPLMENFSEFKLFLFVLFRSFFCVLLLLVFIKTAFKSWNYSSRMDTRLAQNSYHIYIVHFLVLIFLQLALASWSGGSPFIKFGIAAFISITVSYGISHYAIRPYPKQSIAFLYGMFILILVFGRSPIGMG